MRGAMEFSSGKGDMIRAAKPMPRGAQELLYFLDYPEAGLAFLIEAQVH